MTRTRRWLWRGVRWLGSLAAVLVLLIVGDAWQRMGQSATGARLERMKRSPQWADGEFHNPEPLDNHLWESVVGALDVSPHGTPTGQIPVARLDAEALRRDPVSGLRVTWLGHSTNLIEIDGARILTDPSWSERASPVRWAGPMRWFSPPIALSELPPIDAVVISHDHYDHLDRATVIALSEETHALFIVPLGVGAHLAYWGVPEARIAELDWWEHKAVGSLDVVCTPARHASGRTPFDKDRTLWASYALLGARHRVYFSGDTGLFSAMRDIGERFGPFDLTMIEIGQYHRSWPDWHIGPEQAVLAHRWLRGRVLLPVHWGKLQLAYHGWTEPIERVLAAARAEDVHVLAPRPGEPVEPGSTRALQRWWPELPWQTAVQMPIVSTRVSRMEPAPAAP